MERTLREKTPTGNLVLQERDIQWLRAVHRFRFLTTDQAQLLSEGRIAKPRRALNKRLEQLEAHQYLARPKVQRAQSHEKKRHTVHALGQRGAKWLADNDGVEFPRGKGWKTANQLKSWERMAHQIGVVDTVLRIDSMAAETEAVRLTHQQELWALTNWPRKLKPGRLPTRTRVQGQTISRATDPDYTLLFHQQIDGEERRKLCFLEWDNATENFLKADPRASGIAQKHRAYTDAYKRRLHTELYGLNNFRVLFVVNDTADRVAKMQDVYHATVAGKIAPGVFLYTTHAALMGQGPFARIWTNGAGEPVALL